MKHKGHLKKTQTNGEIDPEQGWIVSNKFLYTDDNWKTTKSVFGKYTYGGEERWGVLSDAVVGGYVNGTEIEGGSIKIGKIPGTVDDYTFEVEPDGKVKINAWGGALEEAMINIEAHNYEVIVEASTSPIFDEGVQTITLLCHVYRNYEEITPPGNTKYTWTKKSNNAASDATWNAAHQYTTSNTVAITKSDVDYSAQFFCEVIIPEENGGDD